jgi:hypothetical protein
MNAKVNNLLAGAADKRIYFYHFTFVLTFKLINFFKNAAFSVVTPCDSCNNRRFGGTYRFHHHGNSLLRLLLTVNFITSSLILVTLMMEVVCSSETSVLTRATRRNIAYDGFLHSNCRENRKSF